MKRCDEQLFISDILKFCDQIAEYTEGIDKTAFITNQILQDALVRKLELVGEAVKNISASTRRKHPNVPWKDIAGMRDKLIHHYFSVDLDIVWKTSTKFVPSLKIEIKKLIDASP